MEEGKMKTLMLSLAVLLTLAAALAHPAPASSSPAPPSPATETTTPPAPGERAGQHEQHSSAADASENGFLDDLFEGFAEALGNTALQPLADAALQPLVSAAGNSIVEQIFRAASELVGEWEKSKRQNLEAHPIFIPDKGAFILISSDWPVYKRKSPNKNKYAESLVATADNNTAIDNNQRDHKFVKLNEISSLNTSGDSSFISNGNTVHNNVFKPTKETADNKTTDNDGLAPTSLNRTGGDIFSVSNKASTTNELNKTTSIPYKHETTNEYSTQLPLQDIGDFEISNEVERRNIPDIEENRIRITADEIESESIEHKNDDKRKPNENKRNSRMNDFEINDELNSLSNPTQTYETTVNDDEDMKGIIKLRNVFLVPVPGDVDWSSGVQVGAVREAVKAVVSARRLTERKHQEFEVYLERCFRLLAEALT